MSLNFRNKFEAYLYVIYMMIRILLGKEEK